MDDSRARMLDGLAIAVLGTIWVMTLFAVATLPPTVPMSFGDSGAAQAYGSKYFLLVFAGIGTIVFGVVELTLKSSTLQLNVPFEIPDRCLPAALSLSKAFQRILRVDLLLTFALIELTIVVSDAAGRFIVPSAAFVGFISLVVAIPALLVAGFLYELWRVSRVSNA